MVGYRVSRAGAHHSLCFSIELRRDDAKPAEPVPFLSNFAKVHIGLGTHQLSAVTATGRAFVPALARMIVSSN
jgi:hypothetical protein